MTGNAPHGGVCDRKDGKLPKGRDRAGGGCLGAPERLEVSSQAWLFTLTTQSLGGGGRRITHLRPA